jgi:hypothetical protein
MKKLKNEKTRNMEGRVGYMLLMLISLRFGGSGSSSNNMATAAATTTTSSSTCYSEMRAVTVRLSIINANACLTALVPFESFLGKCDFC